MNRAKNKREIPGSFRDPSGFLFRHEESLFRQINDSYAEEYGRLMDSGLYRKLTDAAWLIPHEEVDSPAALPEKSFKIIQPEAIPFISYPYEWSFSQLKDAALLTLKIQKNAVECGMSLKDCSAYNVQFQKGKPIFIDTLSFERYKEGAPWVAYRQFCQHFLAPLALMHYRDIRLNQLFRVYIDGVPLDLASSLLPLKTRLKFSLLAHIHLHAKSQSYFSDKTVKVKKQSISRNAFLGLIDNLETAVKKLHWQPKGTEWAEYYDDTNYSAQAFDRKEQLVSEFLDKAMPESVWDLGANTGKFSRIAAEKGISTLSFDIDPAAVEKLYRECRKRKETKILPLLLDLANPPSGLGWQHEERMSFMERGPADTVMALALIHHLAIGNNVPLPKIADFFSKLCRTLILEFVPKRDSQVKRLLVTREDIFDEYTQEHFEQAFSPYFDISEKAAIEGSERTLYLMHTRQEVQ